MVETKKKGRRAPRTHRLVIALNDEEYKAIERYVLKYKVKVFNYEFSKKYT